MSDLRFRLRPVPPFRLDLTAWALRRRPANQIDRFEAGVYRRTLAIDGAIVELAVRQIAPAERAELEVSIAGAGARASMRTAGAAIVARILGIECDLSGFYAMARKDRTLAPLAQRLIGMKPPRFPSCFEALTNAIACQQLSLAVGIVVLNRLAGLRGARHEIGGARGFVRPEDLSRVRVASLVGIGFSRAKARALLDLAAVARAADFGDFAVIEALDDAAAVERLCKFRGVGRWSAEYALLRGMGRLNVFPCDDVGGRNALKRWLKLRRELDYDSTRRLVARWAPYQGFIYMHLLVNALIDSGHVAEHAYGG